MMSMTLIVPTVQLVLAIASFFTNGILMLLIGFKSPKTLGSYKYLMLFMSAFEIFYALIDLLVKPEIRTKSSYWFTETDSKRSILPLSVAYPLLLIWACSFGIALACFGVHFVFRYFIVIGNRQWISGIRAFGWLTFPVVSGMTYAITIHYFLHFDEIMDRSLKTAIMDAEGIPIEEIICFGFSVFKTLSSGKVVIDWMQIAGVLLFCLIIALSFYTMIYFGIKGYLAIRTLSDTSHDTTSASSKNLQKQLFYSLVIQTIIPIALIHFPTTVIFISAFLGTSQEIYGRILTVTISLFPAIDPLPSLIIIKPYRQTIKNYLMLKFRKQVQPKASNHLTSNFSGRTTTN